MRGSGDLHAWNDHGAYLTRTGTGGEKLRLTLEHRSAPAIDPLELHLVSAPDGSATHLELVGLSPANSDPTLAQPPALPLHDRILSALSHAARPLSRAQLRDTLRVNNNRLGEVLADLERQGRLRRGDDGISATP